MMTRSLRLGVFFVLFAFNSLFAVNANASTYRLNHKLSSSSQDVFYLIEQLEALLTPVGYVLDRDSIDIDDRLAIANSNLLFIVETPQYAARYVLFEAKSLEDGKNYRGSTYLIIARTDASRKALLPLNSSARALESRIWNQHFFLALSIGILSSEFIQDVRPSDFHIRQSASAFGY